MEKFNQNEVIPTALAKKKRVLIIGTMWHEEEVMKIVDGVTEHLAEHEIFWIYNTVPGCFDLIATIDRLHKDYDLIFCTGFLLKGVTDHYKYTSLGVIHGLIQLTLKIEKPIVNGVFNCTDVSQIAEKASNEEVVKSFVISIIQILNGL